LIEYNGKTVSSGIAEGIVYIVRKKEEMSAGKPEKTDTAAESRKLEKAIAATASAFLDLIQKAQGGGEQETADKYRAYSVLLRDQEFTGAMRDVVRSGRATAEEAVRNVGDALVKTLRTMPDPYLQSRADAMSFVTSKLVSELGEDRNRAKWDTSSRLIVFADDLSMDQYITLGPDNIAAFILRRGSANSHISILSRNRDIPVLVKSNFDPAVVRRCAGHRCLVNGDEGKIYIDPERSQLAAASARRKLEDKSAAVQKAQKAVPEETGADAAAEGTPKDGNRPAEGAAAPSPIRIGANLTEARRTAEAFADGADMIGLYRTEILFLGRVVPPDEEEQYQTYRQILEQAKGKRVVIRTLDIGADQLPAYIDISPDIRPELGRRAIRWCLDHPEFFKVQLRALLRAAADGDMVIMYPLITKMEELDRIQELVGDCAQELKSKGVPFRIPQQGIMIETPAAAIMSDELARRVDYLSIGTNDLAQYTLAADRQSEDMRDYYDQKSPAVLRLIGMTIENAHKAGITVGVCGELASDEEGAALLAKLGADEISVAPGMIGRIRQALSGVQPQGGAHEL
jgi:phosphotransferase system enzyme I (PtsI)